MTKENEELREKVKAAEGIANQFLHSQPPEDEACRRHLLKALSKMADIVGDYRGMVEVEAYDIAWDTDGEEVDLPARVRLMLKSIDRAGEEIADILSDKFGWCVASFRFKVV